MAILSPSILSADFVNLEQDIKATAASGAKWIHIDNMDGQFVPDSVGLISNWKKAGPVYEVPFRTLYSKEIENLIVAGRCTSTNETLWDVMRVIPCCAVTGQAAGTAAAMTDDFSTLDVAALQKKLTQNGVILHEKEIF